MPKVIDKKSNTRITVKPDTIEMDKIGVFFKKSILNSIMKILTMEHSGFRTIKIVKNINKLFTNIDMSKYKHSAELESYIWCIKFISKHWIEGIVDINIIIEGAKRSPEYDNIKANIINNNMNSKSDISAPEAKMIFDLIAEALQYGYLFSLKDEYIDLLSDIDLSDPGSFKETVNRLFLISQSILDIKYSTNLVANKITFNTNDIDSLKDSITQTISTLKGTNNALKTGIRRLNTLLSPAYMNGKLYVYAGLPASFKSGILLKSALDIRKYNPGFKTKTPGMKPAVLYITMENTFFESIERIWNMCFDDAITNYSPEHALHKLCSELGISIMDTNTNDDKKDNESLLDILEENDKSEPNIEIVMKYFPYRSISTDDLFTIIQDLRDENLEVCALVFDYTKRIRPNISVSDNVKLELDRIVNELKALSVICDIPVITGHQLNRVASVSVDNATRQGKGDVTKLAGREHIGSAWEVLETADWLAIVNIEYKPNSDERYLVINAVKRRSIDANESEFAKYTYLAHPFSKNNPFRLIDDIYLDKVLSLQSLVSDIDVLNVEKRNAVPRLKVMAHSEFEE